LRQQKFIKDVLAALNDDSTTEKLLNKLDSVRNILIQSERIKLQLSANFDNIKLSIDPWKFFKNGLEAAKNKQ
jgi:hypothetical protein